jgi:flagellar biosynthetic protein FliQ
MTEPLITELLLMLLQTVALVASPVILAVVIVGVIVNILQTVTQIRDPALAFVPKLVAAAVVLSLAAPWYIQIARQFFENIMELFGRGAIL